MVLKVTLYVASTSIPASPLQCVYFKTAYERSLNVFQTFKSADPECKHILSCVTLD